MRHDWKMHMKAGLLVMLAAAGAALALLAIGAAPLATAVTVAGLVAGATGEAHQWLDNRARVRVGLPPLRDVSLADGLFTALPCLVFAAGVQAHHMRLL